MSGFREETLTEGSEAILREAGLLKTVDLVSWTPSFLIMGVIFYLSSLEQTPGPYVPDYAAHFVAYGFLSAAYYYPLRRIYGKSRIVIFLAFVFASLYGLSDEIHQSFVPGRVSSVKDWVVDSSAGLIVPLVWSKLRLKATD